MFHDQGSIKKAALHLIARHVKERDIHDLRDVFIEMDANGDGHLSYAELREGIAKAGIDIPNLNEIFKDVDWNHHGVIDYTEFVAATLDRRLYLQEDVCWEAFRVFDRDGTGKISY